MLTPFRSKNPLVFPGDRVPGFDPTHPAAGGLSEWSGSSVVVTASNFVELTTGKPLTPNGATSGALQASIGPSVTSSGISNGSSYFAGPNNALSSQPSGATFAAIVFFAAFPGSGAGQNLAGAGTSSQNTSLYLENGLVKLYSNGTATSSGFICVAGHAYFIAAAIGANGTYFVITDLITGGVTTVSTGYTGPNGWPATPVFAFGLNNQNYMAAGMISRKKTPLSALQAWAADPWSFWYPPNVEGLIGSSIRASAIYWQLSLAARLSSVLP